MTGLLIKQLQKHYDKRGFEQGSVVLSGITGIVCNVILSTVKFIVGALSGSVSIITDGFNNFSDASTNIVTIIGAKLSRKPVDKEHPFGHGRVEYIAALVIAFSIFTVSAELFKSSVDKILNPQPLDFSPCYIGVLAAAIAVKLWMAVFNHRLYKLTGNISLKAVRQDSLNDCIATAATIAVLVMSKLFGITWLDGAAGIGVSVFVFLSGIGILRDILNPLLGQAPPRETTCKIEEYVLNNDKILGVHDIIVHNYGGGKLIASAHAEVPADMNIMAAHTLIDSIERKISNELGISITIHTDPVVVHDQTALKYRRLIQSILADYNPEFSFHDFRADTSGGRVKLSFDVVVPFEEKDTDYVKADLLSLLKETCPEAEPDVNIEHSYT